jgi:cyclic pyranopterin phosphate synthase
MSAFTHIDGEGRVRMVDITKKAATLRIAVAQGVVSMNPLTFEKIRNQTIVKGNVLETARIAGIMASKKTSELIPMCHPLNLTNVSIDFFTDESSSSIRIEATARVLGQTGVEMEALTAVSLAALTIYDMCKSYDKNMIISDISLLQKSGGKSGKFVRKKTAKRR